MKRMLLFIIVATAAMSANAEIYRCQVDGKTEFSQTPCAADAEKIEIDYVRPDAASVAAGQERARKLSEDTSEMTRERRIRELGYDIDNASTSIRVLQRQRDAELSQLRRKMGRANNNLAGATWQNSISKEMDAVNQRYDSLIDQHQADIKRWREDVRDLRDR